LFIEVDNMTGVKIHEPTQHYTLIFNTLVLMTLFNEFNARKIHGQRNVFSGLQRNWLFVVIWFVTFILQVLLIQFGSYAFSTAPLTADQWMWCLFFGVGELIWGQVIIAATIVINTIPNAIIPTCKCRKRKSAEAAAPDEEAEDDEEDEEEEHEVDQVGRLPAPADLGGKILWVRGVNRIQTQVRQLSNLFTVTSSAFSPLMFVHFRTLDCVPAGENVLSLN
uniref:Cation_ATPase_C domain-containing protein n=1 Tax=Echinostoma caproni TaxID=27848 RepID=A0A183A8C8_9TREM